MGEPGPPSDLRVMIVDDDLLFADLLADEVGRLLPGPIIVDVFGDPEAAVESLRTDTPDLAFIDVVFRGADMSGFEVASKVHVVDPSSRIVILSAVSTCEWDTTVAMADAVRSHAVQYLRKAIRLTVFRQELAEVIEGFADLPGLVAERLRAHAVNRSELLSPREIEVLDLVARGQPDREIGSRLSISARTVAEHKEHVRWKLGAQTTTQAVALAMTRGLIPLKG